MISLAAMLRLASRSPYRAWPHAAVVFRGGSVVGLATNTRHIHAEVRALNRVKVKKNLTLLSVRVGADGRLKLARPCPECWRYLARHGVKTVLYSTSSGDIEREAVVK